MMIVSDEAVTPQDINTGIMKALTDVGGVSSIFVGHDHGNYLLITLHIFRV